MYADRDENISQRDNKGNWSQHDNQNRNWQSTRDNSSISNSNKEIQARDRGNTRANNFDQHISTSASGDGDGMRGGGRGQIIFVLRKDANEAKTQR